MLPSSFFDSHWCVVLNTKWWFSEKWHTIAVDSSAINFGSFTSIEPSTTILGGSEVFVGMGSTINLTCVIRLSPEPPSSIRWQHNNQVSLLFFFFFFSNEMCEFYVLYNAHQRCPDFIGTSWGREVGRKRGNVNLIPSI